MTIQPIIEEDRRTDRPAKDLVIEKEKPQLSFRVHFEYLPKRHANRDFVPDLQVSSAVLKPDIFRFVDLFAVLGNRSNGLFRRASTAAHVWDLDDLPKVDKELIESVHKAQRSKSRTTNRILPADEKS